MALIKPKDVWNELNKLFTLPNNCVRVDIHLAVDEIVTVDCEYYAEDGGTGETFVQTFNLVPAEEEKDIEYATVPLKLP